MGENSCVWVAGTWWGIKRGIVSIFPWPHKDGLRLRTQGEYSIPLGLILVIHVLSPVASPTFQRQPMGTDELPLSALLFPVQTWVFHGLPASFQFLAYPLTWKMEVTCSFKTLVDFQHTAYVVPEDRMFYNHYCENLKFFKTTHSHFGSCLGVFLGSIVDLWVKHFVYTVTWSQPQLSTVIMDHCDSNGTFMREDNGQCC
jgi:hypothetical protein